MEKQGVLTKPPGVSGETREAVSGGGWAGEPMGGADQGPRSHLFSQPPPPQGPELTAAASGGAL